MLAAAENELDEISLGNNDGFEEKIKDVDTKLENLILELSTGINQINNISTDLRKIESLLEGIESETKSSESSIDAFAKKFKDVNELIREIQDEMNRVNNMTELDAASAFQDAFDRSESLSTSSGELKSILDEAKSIISTYERNLINAKMLTKQTLERFGEVERKIDETKFEYSELDEGMKKLIDMKTAEAELKSAKKLVRDSSDATNKISTDAFELLSEVEIAVDRGRFEFADKMSEINDNVEKMKNFVTETMKSLNGVVERNSDLLKEIEETIDRAKNVEEKALKVQHEVDVSLEHVKRMHAEANEAIGNKNNVIDDARDIFRKLDNFKFKVEDDRMTARRSLEKVDEISSKIQETLEILRKIEKDMDIKYQSATDSLNANLQSKETAQKIADVSEKMKNDVSSLKSTVHEISEKASKNDEYSINFDIGINKMEGREVDDSKFIEMSKENIGRAQQKLENVDNLIDDATKKLDMMLKEVDLMRTWDEVDIDLDEFGERIFEKFSIKKFNSLFLSNFRKTSR